MSLSLSLSLSAGDGHLKKVWEYNAEQGGGRDGLVDTDADVYARLMRDPDANAVYKGIRELMAEEHRLLDEVNSVKVCDSWPRLEEVVGEIADVRLGPFSKLKNTLADLIVARLHFLLLWGLGPRDV